jgi:hypothetical protein
MAWYLEQRLPEDATHLPVVLVGGMVFQVQIRVDVFLEFLQLFLVQALEYAFRVCHLQVCAIFFFVQHRLCRVDE